MLPVAEPEPKTPSCPLRWLSHDATSGLAIPASGAGQAEWAQSGSEERSLGPGEDARR